jgi:hypothetical protein
MISSTRILKYKVITACEAILSVVRHGMQSERDVLIHNQMVKHWFPSKTWDDAIKHLTKGGENSWYYQIANKNKYDIKYVAADLLILAHASDTDYIDMCAKDVKVLGEWLY